MKVLWIVNGLLRDVANELGEKKLVSGTWIESLKEFLVSNDTVELHVLCIIANKKIKVIPDFSRNGVNYHMLKVNGKAIIDAKGRKAKKDINDIISKIQPDIIHVHGTEFSISLNISEDIENKIPICHSIQGLVSCIAKKHFYADLPLKDMSLLERTPIKIQRKSYLRRGKSEEKIIKRYKYFFGRTEWDYSHSIALNSNIRYIKVRELFRKEFIESKPWDVEQIERFSIFYAGGARLPLKGFHKFLDALVLIKQSFANVKVYVAGIIPNKKIPVVGKIGYGRYLNRVIKNKGLSDNVVFLGPLSSREMSEELKKAHCYVLGSSIENSPNTLVEAMLVGAPSVVANVGGVADFAVHNVTSYIYRFEESELLAYYVKKIFNNDSMAKDFSANARKRIKDVLDGSQNDLMNAYNRVIEDFYKELKT